MSTTSRRVGEVISCVNVDAIRMPAPQMCVVLVEGSVHMSTDEH